MIIQFLLKLIFFYFLYTFMKSILRGYFQKRPAGAFQSKRTRSEEYTEGQKSSPASSSDIFEAEYKVVKEEN